jgi:hypothetical protein
MLSTVRPLDKVLEPQRDGSWRLPPAPSANDIAYRLAVWQRHSERAWQWWDERMPARFEALIDMRCGSAA